MHAESMSTPHPHVRGEINTALVRCVEACFACAQACVSCADACLGHANVAWLVQCIRLNRDCADVCLASGLIGARRSGADVPVIAAQLLACELACGRCAAECERHAAEHAHCRICGEICRLCERACREAISSLPGTDAPRH